MDPITQGVLGASLPQAAARKPRQIAAATLVGAVGGMVPDLDVLIRSGTDPLLFLEYHRQFTHSLLFIPLGGVITGAILYALFRRFLGLSLPATLLFTTLGYATHALLDACTTYGTQLLWPLSNARFAWNTVSIIDPLFTLPLLALLLAGLIKRTPRFARAGLVYGLCYLTLGAVQRERAEAVGLAAAEARGHTPLRLEAKPSFANVWLWKVVYETDDYFYVDAVRATLTNTHIAGDRARKLDVAKDFAWLPQSSQQYRDIFRFHWFSNGYLALDPHNAHRIIDVRYSMVPNEIRPLWGIELNPNADAASHVRYYTERDTGPGTRDRFWQLLTGQDQAPMSGTMDR